CSPRDRPAGLDVHSPAFGPDSPARSTMSRPATLGDLRASGWRSQSIKEEVRANTVRKLAAGEPLIEGVIGYDDTVVPQLANALLAGHDIVFLGERGQTETRILR